MKQSGICPKCQCRELKVGKRSGYSAIQGIGNIFFGASTDVYVCKSCGYTEEYVCDKHLKKIKR